MATTYYTAQCTAGSGIQPRAGIALCSVSASYALTGALVVDDVIHMVKIPKGATVTDVLLSSSADLDTDVSPTITLSVGATGRLTQFINATALYKTAAGIVRMTGAQHTFAADDTIQISVTAGPTIGTAAATLTLFVIYTMDL